MTHTFTNIKNTDLSIFLSVPLMHIFLVVVAIFSPKKTPWYPCIRSFSVVLWALMEGNPHYIKWIENDTQHSNIFWFWDCVWPTVTTHLHRRRLRSDSLWLKCSESCYYSTLNVSFTTHIRQALLINLNRNDERHATIANINCYELFIDYV